jgi:hypothetical protein
MQHEVIVNNRREIRENTLNLNYKYQPVDAIIQSPLSTVKIVRNISSLCEQFANILNTNHRKHTVSQLKILNIYICQDAVAVYSEKQGKIMNKYLVCERVNINALHSVYSLRARARVCVCLFVLYASHNE